MARARRGSGSIRQRPDGRWEIREFRDGRSVSFYGETLSAARAKSAAAKRQGRSASGGTLADWLAEYLTGEQGRLRPQTWAGYETKLRVHVLPHLGHVRLTQLHERHFVGLAATITRPTGPLSETSAHHVITILGTALRAAQSRGLVSRVPAYKAPRMRHRPKHTLSREEAGRVIEVAQGHPLGAAYILALTIGARSGEIRALRWKDLDLVAGTVTIVSSVVIGYSKGQEIDDPKTAAARRTVRIPPVAVEALKALPAEGELVFGGDRPLRAHRFLRAGIFEAAGLPPMPFHDLRHTAATHMLEDGVPAHVVAKVLGHAHVGVTLGIYAHVTPAMLSSATEAMAARYPIRVVGKELGQDESLDQKIVGK
jgi:integrase